MKQPRKPASGAGPKELWSRFAAAHAADLLEDYGGIWRTGLDYLVEIREPVVLISQIQRSGGSLLSQLFDAHPQCHAHPSELGIGHPRRSNWPQLELEAGPEAWYEVLREQKPVQHLHNGYRKSGFGGKPQRFPFVFLPALQRLIFDRCVASRPVEGERDVFDCYFTSYFNAWLDSHNLRAGPKKIVTAFLPGVSTDPGSLERFFHAYPDGTLISITRDPRGWYASARGTRSQFKTLDEALARWARSALAGLEAAERFRDRVILLTYEDLVQETERTLSAVADRLGIDMLPTLLEPTFNGWGIMANSTEAVERAGIISERARGYANSLEPEAIRRIEQLSGALYENVQEHALR